MRLDALNFPSITKTEYLAIVRALKETQLNALLTRPISSAENHLLYDYKGQYKPRNPKSIIEIFV